MRLFITTLSMLSVIAFGHALAGYGTSLMGNEINSQYVIYGLAGGFILGGLALLLWYRHRRDFFDYEDKEEENQNMNS